MANIPVAPFYVPRPPDDRLWPGLIAGPDPSAVLGQLLTSGKIFGRGGQVYTKRWLPHYLYNEHSNWNWGTAPRNSDLLAPILTNVKFYGRGGQAPTNDWKPFYDYNDASLWTSYQRNQSLLSPVAAPFGGARWSYNLDDPVPWRPYQIQSQSLLAVPFFPELRARDHDAPATWQPYQVRNQSLFVVGTPFVVEGWRQWATTYNDASLWPAASVSVSLPMLGTVVSPSAVGTASFEPNEPGAWQRVSYHNLVGTSVAVNNPFPSLGWHYDYDEASFWFWRVPRSAVLAPLLTAGGKPPTKPWRYDFDQASVWNAKPLGFNVLNVAVNAPFVSKGWHYDLDQASVWSARPIGINVVTAATITYPTYATCSYVQPDDAAPWSRFGYRNSVAITSFVNPFPSLPWHYDLDQSSVWNAKPTGTNVLTAATITYPTYATRRYIQPDDAALWLCFAYRNSVAVASFVNPFPSRAWHYDYNEASFWNAKPLGVNVLTASTIIYPAYAACTYVQPDDHGNWQRFGYRNSLIGISFATPKVSRGWRYDYDVAGAFWNARPVATNLSIATIAFPTKLDRAYILPGDEQAVWRAAPVGINRLVATVTITLPTASTAYYDAENIAPLWQRFGYRNAVVTFSFGNPFFSKGWHLDYNDASFWSWPAPTSFYTINFAGPPVPTPPTPTRHIGRVRHPHIVRIPLEEWEQRERQFNRKVWDELLEALEAAEERAEQLREKNRLKQARHLEQATQAAASALAEAELFRVTQAAELEALTRALNGAAKADATAKTIYEAEIRARAVLAYIEAMEDDEEAITLLLIS